MALLPQTGCTRVRWVLWAKNAAAGAPPAGPSGHPRTAPRLTRPSHAGPTGTRRTPGAGTGPPCLGAPPLPAQMNPIRSPRAAGEETIDVLRSASRVGAGLDPLPVPVLDDRTPRMHDDPAWTGCGRWRHRGSIRPTAAGTPSRPVLQHVPALARLWHRCTPRRRWQHHPAQDREHGHDPRQRQDRSHQTPRGRHSPHPGMSGPLRSMPGEVNSAANASIVSSPAAAPSWISAYTRCRSASIVSAHTVWLPHSRSVPAPVWRKHRGHTDGRSPIPAGGGPYASHHQRPPASATVITGPGERGLDLEHGVQLPAEVVPATVVDARRVRGRMAHDVLDPVQGNPGVQCCRRPRLA